MTAVFLVIHVILAVTMVILVLLQRSDGGALGGIGGGASFGGVMSGRQSANFLTRATAVLAACFMGTSLLLAILASNTTQPTSILDTGAPGQSESLDPLEDLLDQEPSVPVAE
jgi:preprotein translocase subunit SecG